MTLFSLLLLAVLAVAQNVDNFVLAGAYRFQNILIPKGTNSLMAILSGVSTGLAALAGWSLGEKIAGSGHWEMADSIARGLLIMLGVWTLVGYFRKKLFPQLQDAGGLRSKRGAIPAREAPCPISHSEAIIAATALAMDNLAPSFAFGVRHPKATFVSLFTLPVLTAGFSIILVAWGQRAGRHGRSRLNHPSFYSLSPQLISGLLIIGVALFDPGDLARGLIKQ